MNDPISGLRAACTKLFKTNFAPPLPFLKRMTTLATRDVPKPRDSAVRSSDPAVSPYVRKTLFDFI